MKLFNSTKNVLIFMVCATTVVLVFDIYIFIILSSKNGGVVSLADQIKSVLEERKKQEILDTIIKDNKISIDKVISYFVTGDKVVSFIESIDTISKQSFVSANIDNIQTEDFPSSNSGTSTTDNLSKMQKLHITIKVEGSWGDLYKFLALLETIPYKTTIDSVSFNKNGVSKDTPGFPWSSQFILTAIVIK